MIVPTKLNAATKMLDELLPPGGRRSVAEIEWSARYHRIGWRTVERAKQRAGTIRAVKQDGRHRLPWIWVRE